MASAALAQNETTTTSRPAIPFADYQALKFTLHKSVFDRIRLETLMGVEAEAARTEIRAVVSKAIEAQQVQFSLADKERLIEEMMNEVLGLGPLEPLLADPTLSDILVTTPKLVYVERDGKLIRVPVEFKDDAHLVRTIEKIAARVGRRIDETSPMVDARLPDGSRVNAVIPPIAVDGPLLSIRRFRADRLDAERLLENRTYTAEMLALLKACVRARLNIVVSGGTGAGKTTLLNVLSAFIPEEERIVTIEDAAELQMKQTHVARMETRPPSIEGEGAIRQRHLVINALRMRPDRIIVGEVRGDEALDMLQAMNTGHDGSLTTIHANSPRDAISRLEVMVSMANSNIHLRAIRQQVSSAVDLFVQLSRLSDGSRRITHLTECVGMEGDVVTLQDIFLFEKFGVGPAGRVMGRFRPTGIRPKFTERLRAAGFELPASLFQSIVELR